MSVLRLRQDLATETVEVKEVFFTILLSHSFFLSEPLHLPTYQFHLSHQCLVTNNPVTTVRPSGLGLLFGYQALGAT